MHLHWKTILLSPFYIHNRHTIEKQTTSSLWEQVPDSYLRSLQSGRCSIALHEWTRSNNVIVMEVSQNGDGLAKDECKPHEYVSPFAADISGGNKGHWNLQITIKIILPSQVYKPHLILFVEKKKKMKNLNFRSVQIL